MMHGDYAILCVVYKNMLPSKLFTPYELLDFHNNSDRYITVQLKKYGMGKSSHTISE